MSIVVGSAIFLSCRWSYQIDRINYDPKGKAVKRFRRKENPKVRGDDRKGNIPAVRAVKLDIFCRNKTFTGKAVRPSAGMIEVPTVGEIMFQLRKAVTAAPTEKKVDG